MLQTNLSQPFKKQCWPEVPNAGSAAFVYTSWQTVRCFPTVRIEESCMPHDLALSTYRGDLGDGLIARWSTPADTRKSDCSLPPSTATAPRAAQRAHAAPGTHIDERHRIFMDDGDFAVVEDTTQPERPIVACTCFWRHQWHYAGSRLAWVARSTWRRTQPIASAGWCAPSSRWSIRAVRPRGTCCRRLPASPTSIGSSAMNTSWTWKAAALSISRRSLTRRQRNRNPITCARQPRRTFHCWRFVRATTQQ